MIPISSTSLEINCKIHNLFDYNLLLQKKFLIEKKEGDIRQIILRIIRTMKSSIEYHENIIKFLIDARVPEIILFDVDRFKQVLFNLLTNAN